jgi:hypothetical protein
MRWPAAVTAVAAVIVFVPPARGAWLRFFDSLRIARPERVSVNVPSFTGPGANRQLQNIVASMVADTASVILDEKEQPAPGAAAAARLAGFPPRLPAERKDAPQLTVVGAHEVTMTVGLSQLSTILMEAGVGAGARALPRTLDGAKVTIRTPRAVRAEYGHCPQPETPTLQSQLQGQSAPAAADYSDCVALTEGPPTTVEAPPDLDLRQLVGIALELAGMSPAQSREFRDTLDWKSLFGLAVPRFIRSYQTVDVGGSPGALLGTAFRRGPTYELIWTSGGMVYSLVGYGSSGDALPIARSLSAGGAR